MKKTLLISAFIASLANAQVNIQKTSGTNVLSNGPIVVGNGNSITATGNGTIVATGGTATTVPWSGVTGTPTTMTGYGITNTLATTAPLTGGGTIASGLTLAIPAATSSINGYLTSADWTTFNGKESALTFSTPLARTVNTISIPAATGSVSGYLTSTDWTTFNGKQPLITTSTALAAGSLTLALSPLGVTSGGNGLIAATLGDLRYGSGTNTLANLAGNTSATMSVLTQTGNGTVSAAPVWTSTTGTGNVVRATSPVLVTPNLGTPTTLVLTNATGLPNSGLGNSTITLGSTSIALGSTSLTPAGLTSIGVNSVTAATGQSLTLTGGDTGASLALGAGTNADATVTSKGTGNVVLTPSGTGYSSVSNATRFRLPYDATHYWEFKGDFGNAAGELSLMYNGSVKGVLTPTGNFLWGTGTDISGSAGLKVAGTTAATNTTSGAVQIGSNIGLSGNAGGPSYFGGVLNVGDGSVSVPAYSFGADTNSGWYRGGGDAVRLALGGVETLNMDLGASIATAVMQWKSTLSASTSLAGAFRVGDGTTAATNVAIGGGKINAGADISAVGVASTGGVSNTVSGDSNLRLTSSTAVTGRDWYVRSTSSGVFDIFDNTSGGRRFSINSSGDATISSTSPSTGVGTGALQVAGGIYAGAASVFGAGTTVGGIVVTNSATLSGAGAIPITTSLVKYTSTGVAQALTLANGVDGQRLTIVHDVDGGSGVLTPTTKTGFSTITITNAGDAVDLVYVTTRGWMVTGSYGVTIAP